MRLLWLDIALIGLILTGSATIVIVGASGSPSLIAPSHNAGAAFFDDFEAEGLDAEKWLIAKKQWGGLGVNGGVVPQNVAVSDGNLVLEAHGDHYEGPVQGINKYGVARGHGKRVGAAIATRAYWGSGRYEVRAKIAPHLGVCSAFWTLHYKEVTSGEPAYESVGADGDCYVTNHEINIEFPGRPGRDAFDEISFQHGLFNTWRGLRPGEFSDNYLEVGDLLSDGRYHTYRFDWHSGGAEDDSTPRVDFYIDGQLIHTSYDNIPTHAGRFWLGVWFPERWVGDPEFDQARMYIDWVRVTPFNEPGDEWVAESYASQGWAAPQEYPGYGRPGVEQPVQQISGEVLKIESFDAASPKTLLGGQYRQFSRVPARAVVQPTDGEHYGESGRSLRVRYDKAKQGWCGFWMRFKPEGQVVDARPYRYLTFYVKGEKGGEDFDIGLSWDRQWGADHDPRPAGNIRDFLPNGVTKQWQKVVVPLSLVLRLDLNVMSGFAVICRPGRGSFYIDEVRLEG